MSSRDLAGRGDRLLQRPGQPAQLADVLERVLDKGIVIAGDIQINLLDIELLTVKLRLLVASADKAREMGIDWWEGDPFLSSRGQRDGALESRLRRLEAAAGIDDEEAG
jgi:Gas vesicle protein